MTSSPSLDSGTQNLQSLPSPSGRGSFGLGFVIVALLALVVVPLWIGNRTDAIRDELAEEIEPARAQADRLRMAMDRQVVNMRGWRLSGDDLYLDRYAEAVSDRLDAYRQLQYHASILSPPFEELLEDFDRAAIAWEEAHRHFLQPGTPAPPPQAPATREDLFDAATLAGNALQAHLIQEAVDRRQAIQREERRGFALTAMLGMLAIIAALIVAGVSRRLVVYGRDAHEAVVERERLAREIDRQRHLLQTITDNATTALMMMDTEGRGTFWNPAAARMTGFAAEEVLGRRIHDLIHHTRPDGTAFPYEECPIDQALPAGAELKNHEDVLIRKNGESFPAICAAKPIPGSGGRRTGTVIEIRDVTEERRADEALHLAKEQAEAANQAKTAFLATMSHELRTPLNAILGFSDLLDAGVPEAIPDRARAQVKRIDQSARHLLRIIEEILTFSHVEAAQEKVEDEIVELRAVVRTVLQMVQPLAERNDLTLVTDLGGAPETIRTDAQKMKQILINLLSNAIKFSPGGTVELTAWQDDREVILRVRDTGIGIAPENLSRVFDPFWQVDQSHTRSTGGTGLGLTVSRSLARLLGGDILVHSEPGEGSTFELHLPARPPL